MVEGEACLLDSNILLRISKNDDPQQPIIANALKALIGQGVRLCYTSQTLAEFWNCLDASCRQEQLRPNRCRNGPPCARDRAGFRASAGQPRKP